MISASSTGVPRWRGAASSSATAMSSYISTHIGRRKMAPSRELKLKKEKLKQHQEEFSNIEEIVYQTAGGISMDELLDLQKKIKKDLRLRTSRVDWRTKTGIIL